MNGVRIDDNGNLVKLTLADKKAGPLSKSSPAGIVIWVCSLERDLTLETNVG